MNIYTFIVTVQPFAEPKEVITQGVFRIVAPMIKSAERVLEAGVIDKLAHPKVVVSFALSSEEALTPRLLSGNPWCELENMESWIVKHVKSQ